MKTIQVPDFKTLNELYDFFMAAYSHCPFHRHLTAYASKDEVKIICELGIKQGGSTAALLITQPDELYSYDIRISQIKSNLFRRLSGRTKLSIIEADSTQVKCVPCDMLVIDTYHTQEHIAIELQLHAPQVRHYIVCHDANYPKGSKPEGMLRATITEYANKNGWVVDMDDPTATGTMAIRRC